MIDQEEIKDLFQDLTGAIEGIPKAISEALAKQQPIEVNVAAPNVAAPNVSAPVVHVGAPNVTIEQPAKCGWKFTVIERDRNNLIKTFTATPIS